LFISEGEVVPIEMKIKSKCSVDQVLKYALLGRAVEIQQKQQKEHYLVLLGSGAIMSQFPQRFNQATNSPMPSKNEDLTKFLANKPKVFSPKPAGIAADRGP